MLMAALLMRNSQRTRTDVGALCLNRGAFRWTRIRLGRSIHDKAAAAVAAAESEDDDAQDPRLRSWQVWPR
jgi:hypothetical protein